MANCPNCGAALSCGCQRKTASDGKQGCVQCIPKYEQALKQGRKEINRFSSDPSSRKMPVPSTNKDPRLN
jgi:transcription elongation factor Elf1